MTSSNVIVDGFDVFAFETFALGISVSSVAFGRLGDPRNMSITSFGMP